ncbi:unnamed protein product [Discosporangium mesarthrocarpum]
MSCYFGMPDDCNLVDRPLDYMADLQMLLTYGLIQAWFCDILERDRFWHLVSWRRWYFYVAFLVSGPAFSAIADIPALESSLSTGSHYTALQISVYILVAAVITICVAWHFRYASHVLGAGAGRLDLGHNELHNTGGISHNSRDRIRDAEGGGGRGGQGSVRNGGWAWGERDGDGLVVDQWDPRNFQVYIVSRLVVMTFFAVYALLGLESEGGIELHHYSLAWMLSLMAQFRHGISVLWLAITVGVFVQGLGAYHT